MTDRDSNRSTREPEACQSVLAEVGVPAVQTVVSGVLGMAMAFAASILAARSLGREGNGELVLGMNLVLAAASIAGLSVAGLAGAGVASSRLRPSWVERVNLLHAVLSVLVLWSVLSVLDCVTPTTRRSLLPWSVSWLAAAMAGGVVWQGGLRALRVGTREIGRVNTQQILMGAALLVAWTLCTLAEAGSLAFWLSWGGTSVGSTIVLAGRTGPRTEGPVPRPAESVGALFRQATALHLGVLGAMLIMRLNPVLIAELLGTEAVGVYGVASSLAARVGTLALAFGTSLIGAVGTRSEQAAWEVVERIAAIFVPLLVLLAAVLAVLAYPVVAILFGPAYRDSGFLVPVLVVGQTANAFFYALLQPYLLTVRNDVVVWTAAAWVGLAAMIPLAFVGTSQFGVAGAAAAESLAYVIALCVSIFAIHARYQRSVWPLLVPRPGNWRLVWEVVKPGFCRRLGCLRGKRC